MTHPFFEFFNRNRPPIDPDSSKWPKEWSTVYFKYYPRLPQVKLSKPRLGNFSLEKTILKRKSNRNFSKKGLNLDELSKLLFYSCGIIEGEGDESRRAYPSGGARYPLEVYLAVFNVEKLTAGIYHYNVKQHLLEFLSEDKEEVEVIKNAFHYDFPKRASAVFIFSMVPNRSTIKYGNLALKIGLIEAGHLAENIYLITQALRLKCCSVGGLRENLVHPILDIDGVTEVAFYAVAVGK